MRRLAPVVLALALGCGPTCVDADGDGYGDACARGPDCDDTNAARNTDCVAQPAPDCEANPSATGCLCLPGSVSSCFSFEGATPGAGPCRAGAAICRASHWGLCTGEVGPGFETCNHVDDDCDGRTDEGALSPCGGCDATCVGGVWGDGSDPFTATDVLEVTDYGELTLARHDYVASTVWAANSADGTISRIDAASAREVARYSTVLGAPHGDEPSRVAVDWNQDAWVANRAFDGQGTLTKIASDPSRCVDRDHDGTIETSSGPTDVRADDECVLFTVPIGASMEVPRALAIDGGRIDGVGGGHAWVGLFSGEAVLEVDGDTGATLRRIPTPSFAPYSAAVDPWGRLWMSSRDGYLARVDPLSGDVQLTEVPLACWLVYALAIDREGRIGLTGFSCDSVAVYDPHNGGIQRVTTPPSTRGAVFDPSGELWVAHTGGLVSMLDVAPLRVRRTIDLRAAGASPIETVGIASDTIGHVWAVSEHGGEGDLGVASRVDIDGGVVSAQVTIGGAPHTQGDLTGVVRGGAFEPMGSETHLFTGCPNGALTSWLRLHVVADTGGAGRIVLDARHATDEAGLPSAAWTTVGALPDAMEPFDLASLPEGGVVEIRATLTTSARLGAPRLGRIGLEWHCPGPV
jgi:streptogramin lyase